MGGFINFLSNLVHPQQQQKQQAQPVNNYPSNFIGPVKPNQTIGGQSPYSQQGVLGASTGPTPQTGGQGAGVGAAGGGNAPQLNLTPPQTGYQGPNPDQVTAQLQSQYGAARQDIQNQSPLLDQSYGQAKTDIGNALTTTQQQAQSQKQNLDTDFGTVLRNQVKTYRDLNQQRQGTFSALGTMDSSAYGDAQQRADQSLSEQQSQAQTQQARSKNDVDTALTSYTNQAQSQLAQIATQYQQGKNAIASALAQNDNQGAQAISQALDQLRTRAQDVQNNMLNFANQAAQLKALGYGVRTNIGNINAQPFAQSANSFLGNYGAQQNAIYQNQLPTGLQGQQGYIAPGQAGQKINPLTGLPQ